MTRMTTATATVTIRNELGLHARPAGRLREAAIVFTSTITVTREDNGEGVDAKSLLSLLRLAAACGVTLRIDAAGDDAEAAVAALVALVEAGFEEM